jgi:SAM-dependent methyltransferase
MLKQLRALTRPLVGTLFHPQWLYERGTPPLLDSLNSIAGDGIVLDIGCFNRWAAAHVPKDCYYIGLDYYETAMNWYGSVPDVFGEAQSLPIKSGAIHTVLLIDVLEHLTNHSGVLSEIRRVLKPGGTVIMKVPFLYPLHDEPRDYRRFTVHGLKEMAESSGFSIVNCKPIGHPVETAVLLGNLALSKTAVGWMKARNPAALVVLFAPILFLMANLIARFISLISEDDDYMPFSYQLTLIKKVTPN